MSAIIKGYKSGAPNAACNVRALLLWPLVSIHMCTHTTCANIIFVCSSSSYILLLLIPIFHQYWKYCSQMAGLGQLVRRLDLFCVWGRHWGEGGGLRNRQYVVRTHSRSHTRSHHTTLCMVAKLATYMEWPVATRLIDRLRECVLHLCSGTLPSQGWPSTHVAERAISRTQVQVGIRDLVGRGCLSGNRG